MCAELDVTEAGYFAWRRRGQSQRSKSDGNLMRSVRQIFDASRQTYGSPRILTELRSSGISVSNKRVARLMRFSGLKAKKRNRSKASSISPGILPAAPNTLGRRFTVQRPNCSWVSDITQIATAEGWLYLAVVIDLYSRRVVGWSMSKNNNSDLAIAALNMALLNRESHKLLVHSDRGRQYTNQAYYDFLETHHITASMSRKGNCWDNAVAESFFASLKAELRQPYGWRSRSQARTAIFEYIEIWYNSQRRHSANGYLSPAAFEAASVN